MVSDKPKWLDLVWMEQLTCYLYLFFNNKQDVLTLFLGHIDTIWIHELICLFLVPPFWDKAFNSSSESCNNIIVNINMIAMDWSWRGWKKGSDRQISLSWEKGQTNSLIPPIIEATLIILSFTHLPLIPKADVQSFNDFFRA